MTQSILSDALKQEIQWWLSQEQEDQYRQEIQTLVDQNNETQLLQLFGQKLSFGTAGLRGVLGPGPNAMNLTVIRQVTAGLAHYLLSFKTEDLISMEDQIPKTEPARGRIAIAYDARHRSLAFAQESARILGGFGFEVYLAPTYCPTPMLAFSVLELSCLAGIMVTASHNPPQDNGFKVYWGNGAQIIPPIDAGIKSASEALTNLKEIKAPSLDQLREQGLLHDIPASLFEDYLKELDKNRLYHANHRDLKIVYTAMHGVGKKYAYAVLDRFGYQNIIPVLSQVEADPDFPTVKFPNPEEPGALDLAKEAISRENADIVLANDPDADRLAVVAKNQYGQYQAFNGDQLGALIAHEIIEHSPKEKLQNGMMATTIVSSTLLEKMAKQAHLAFSETLTGFKWIASAGMDHEVKGGKFLFGYEEAIGYSVHGIVRDKDGISVCLLVADMAQRAKTQHKTLWQILDEIYCRYGVYLSSQKNLLKPGLSGLIEIQALMQNLRNQNIQEIAGIKVIEFVDFKDHPTLKGNVLRYKLEDGSRILARPSGTEPKIKFYFEICQKVDQDIESAKSMGQDKLKLLESAWMRLLDA